MARKRASANPSIEFTILVAVFGVALVLAGIKVAITLGLLVILGFATWQIRQAVLKRKAFNSWFHNAKGMENIAEMTPLQFEIFVSEVYARLGYNTQLTPRSGDDGIDVIAKKNGNIYAIQVKKTAKPTGSPVIQTLSGSMVHIGARYGICVSASGFTPDAKRFAYGKNISLVSGQDLADLLQKI